MDPKMHKSEQLKIERELFPSCIQAPLKYYNKTKISNDSLKRNKRKEQHLFFLDERLSLSFANRKETSVNRVNNWFMKQQHDQSAREPLIDICGNIALRKNNKKSIKTTKNSSKENIQWSNKPNKPKFKQISSPIENKSKYKPNGRNDSVFNKYNDESGIVIDDDSTFEDSQNEIIDKDRLAFVAVKKADDKCIVENNFSTSNETKIKTYSSTFKNVPFYKKSNLSNDSYITRNLKYDETSNNLSVTIETNNCITTISVNQNVTNNRDSKRSVPVQTDITDILDRDLLWFKKEKEVQKEDPQPADKPNIIIYDSSSDHETNEISQVEETTSGHGDRGILSQLDPKSNLSAVRVARRLSPASSNSSEKENLDPNKIRKRKVLFKGRKKKKRKF